MALNKDIISDAGLSASYHRISKVAINYDTNQSIVTVESYISNKYREKAKQADEAKEALTNLFKQLDMTTDQTVITALSEKIQNIQRKNEEVLNNTYSVSSKDIFFDFIPEETSYVGYYNALKELEEFKDADLI